MSGGCFSRVHSSAFARLTANVVEDGECWLGQETRENRGGYKRVNFRVPGLGSRHVTLTAHVAAWVLWHTDPAASTDELYLAYLEFRASGLELDHTCNTPACRRPTHLEPVTRRENEHRKHARRRALLTDPTISTEF